MKYIDITEIVQRLNGVFSGQFNDFLDDKKFKCVYCGNRIPISYLAKSHKNQRITNSKSMCNECYAYNKAKTGLMQVVLTFLREIHPELSEKELSELCKTSINNIPPEIIKLKSILNKITKKLKDYETSKH